MSRKLAKIHVIFKKWNTSSTCRITTGGLGTAIPKNVQDIIKLYIYCTVVYCNCATCTVNAFHLCTVCLCCSCFCLPFHFPSCLKNAGFFTSKA